MCIASEGTFNFSDSNNFGASNTISAALVEVEPGGMRELHWHPKPGYAICPVCRTLHGAKQPHSKRYDYAAIPSAAETADGWQSLSPLQLASGADRCRPPVRGSPHFAGPGGLVAVILVRSVSLAAYVADNADQALEHWRRGERGHTVLILPNLLRGFSVVVMSSGFGAAIGVAEAVSTTMRQVERLHVLSHRVLLVLSVIAFFVLVFSAANALVQFLVRQLSAPAPMR